MPVSGLNDPANPSKNNGAYPHTSTIHAQNAKPNYTPPPNFAQPSYLIKGSNPPEGQGIVAPKKNLDVKAFYSQLPSIAITVSH